jgi:hypothetical protein
MTTIPDGDLLPEGVSFPLPAELHFGSNLKWCSPPIQNLGRTISPDLPPEPEWALIPSPANPQSGDLSTQHHSSINESPFHEASNEPDWALFPLRPGEMSQNSVECGSTLSQPSQDTETLSASFFYTDFHENGSGFATGIDFVSGENSLESNPNGPSLSPSDHCPSDAEHMDAGDIESLNGIPSADELSDERFSDTFSDLISENAPSNLLPTDDAIDQIGVYSNNTVFALREELQRQFIPPPCSINTEHYGAKTMSVKYYRSWRVVKV